MARPLCSTAAVMETSHTHRHLFVFPPPGQTNMQDGEKKKSGLKSSTRGPFTRLPDCWLGPVRVSLGVVYRKMLYVLHTHTHLHTYWLQWLSRKLPPRPPIPPNYPPLCSHRQSASPERSKDRAAFMEDGFQRHGLVRFLAAAAASR